MFDHDNEDDSRFRLTEAEAWYHDNLSFFDSVSFPIELPKEIEWFYLSVYKPFMIDVRKAMPEFIAEFYPLIDMEYRPELTHRINRRIEGAAHDFILLMRAMMEFSKTGKDLREKYPRMDRCLQIYRESRQPFYIAPTFWDKFEAFTQEEKQQLIEENRREEDASFAIYDKPRASFYNILQTAFFRYVPEVADFNNDQWAMYENFLGAEFTEFTIQLEYINNLIEYDFSIEEFDLPYEQYIKLLSERVRKRRSEQLHRKN